MSKIINIDGGVGRCIAFTGAIKEPVDIICAFPMVFFNHPMVKRVYPPTTPYLYDYIKDSDYIQPEPYIMKEYYREQKHIINCFNIEVNGSDEFNLPKIFLTEEEIAQAKISVDQKTILFQPFGSKIGGKRTLSREYAQKIVDKLKEKGYRVILIDLTEDLAGVEKYNLSIRQIVSLIPYVKKCIGVDSFLQHAAAALNVPMTVFWGGTLPSQVGYEMHENILPKVIPHPIPNRLPHNILNEDSINLGPDESDDNLQKVCNIIS